jgi:GNAT superfamily N-acetyltransferase
MLTQTAAEIALAETDDAIDRCFPVMRQLRPELEPAAFVARVRELQGTGYYLAALRDDGVVRAVAGYRFLDMLWSGRVLYVDDLVTDEGARSAGHGGRLFDWLVERAREAECAALHLDSGVQRARAHRFYFIRRMSIVGYHFVLPLR